MARKSEHDQPHVIEEIESVAERGAQWIRDHLALTIAALLIALGTAGGIGAFSAHQTRNAEAASDAFDRVHAEFMRAMGADPNAFEMPELANPVAAAEIRSEFTEQFGAVAEAHAGTVAAALARFEQGKLAAEAGETDAAVAIWQRAIDELDDNPKLRALFEQRIGLAYEVDARWLEAAQAHERAAAVDGYPLRYWALAEAARCFQQAGEIERAREIALRLGAEAPDLMLPQHLSALFAELRQMPAR